ncbi:MAG: YjhG/YagF family D-xylonate dehydratase [Planctomycetales bacterium]|nr:YjhG/YagF family D-xylonate dehydratase [Planctomycetales bacterium]
MPLELFDDDPALYEVLTHSEGPQGALPLSAAMLRDDPSGNLFGWTQDAAMGWNPQELGRDEYLILSTLGGVRAPDGTPIALGYHTGHWEVGLLVEEAARTLRSQRAIPFAGFCSDPCDGRSQGTAGMYDSLAYRNDAALVLGRLIRSLPTRRGVLGVATCDKGHPAMMMALAAARDLPGVIVPGGVTLPPSHGEDAGKVQTLGARFSHGLIDLQTAAEMGCRACATPGGGCQFLGTAASAQVVGEALGLSLPHSALAPSGQRLWSRIATQSAEAVVARHAARLTTGEVLTEDSLHNAMTVLAAFGGSTNLLIHIPAVAHAAGLNRPAVSDWRRIMQSTPRLVSVLPNGPVEHPTVRVFLAGGTPEVMLHLRELGLLRLTARTADGSSLDESLDRWAASPRRRLLRQRLRDADGVDPDDVIRSPDAALRSGMTSTLAFPVGNLAPEGSVVKATSIDPSLLNQGVYQHVGPARVFTSERAAMHAVKSTGPDALHPGDVLVLAGCGPLGTGMEETYQLTSALKHLPWGKHIPLVTDARFSGVSTGACIGHVGPEALAGGPLGKLRDGDLIEIEIAAGGGRVDLAGWDGQRRSAAEVEQELARRPLRDDLHPADGLPDATRLWAALQSTSGGVWGGCVYDVDAIVQKLQ